MRRAVVCVLDGLRRDLVTPANTPSLVHLAGRAQWFDAHRSVFPSATRVVSAALATGCLPGRNELQGNAMALREHGRIVAHDAGHPGFLQHKRRVTGRALAMPTLAERLAGKGGAIIYSNVSPGAAYAHDPDGYGYVYHRAGCYGPGREAIDAPGMREIALDAAGDAVMADRFIADALGERRPALALVWLAEPDTVQHARPLGSREHLAVLREADATAGRVIAAVDRLRQHGDDVLLIVCSDHGHQTVSRVVDVEAELIGAGLKEGPASSDVLAPANGNAVLVYVDAKAEGRLPEVEAFFRSRDWVDSVIPAAKLDSVGQTARHGLAMAVSLRSDDLCNPYGIPGRSVEARPAPGKSPHLDCGQHGGLGRYEQAPFLIVEGAGFAGRSRRAAPTSIVDIAPTVLSHLREPSDGMDGKPLQEPAP